MPLKTRPLSASSVGSARSMTFLLQKVSEMPRLTSKHSVNSASSWPELLLSSGNCASDAGLGRRSRQAVAVFGEPDDAPVLPWEFRKEQRTEQPKPLLKSNKLTRRASLSFGPEWLKELELPAQIATVDSPCMKASRKKPVSKVLLDANTKHLEGGPIERKLNVVDNGQLSVVLEQKTVFRQRPASATTLERKTAPEELPSRPSTAYLFRSPSASSLVASGGSYVEWRIPGASLIGRCKAEELRLKSTTLTSPMFLARGEQFVLKFWPRGRSTANGSCWATAGLFPLNPSVHLRFKLHIGPRQKPWVCNASSSVLYANHRSAEHQYLDAWGECPFSWENLPDGVLLIGCEVLENCRDGVVPTEAQRLRATFADMSAAWPFQFPAHNHAESM